MYGEFRSRRRGLGEVANVRDLRPLADRGLSNTKFRGVRGGVDVLLRINENAGADRARGRFEKAAFCARIARDAGVPVPEVLDVGVLPNGRPYSVERWVEGSPADLVRDEAERIRIWDAVGAAIGRVHRIGLEGAEQRYELGYDGEGPTMSWAEQLDRVTRFLWADESLALSDPQKRRLASALAGLDVSRYPPCLNHGDLKLDNVLVQDGAIVAVLDWELARFAPAPLEWSTSVEPAVLPSKTWAIARGPERDTLLRALGGDPPAFDLFAASDALANLGWYGQVLRDGRPDLEILRIRHANYLAGVREIFDRVVR